MRDATITVEVLNWGKYNPRGDVKKPSWFRFENDLVDGPSMFNFTPIEFKTWVYILSQASRCNASIVVLNVGHANRAAKLPAKVIESAILKLVAIQAVKVVSNSQPEPSGTLRARDVRGRDSPATNERTNERNGTNGGPRTRALRATPTPPVVVNQEPPPEGLEPVRALLDARGVATPVRVRWLETFPDVAWVVQEIRKAALWEESNPTRRKKNFAAFISRWLAKDWDTRRPSVTVVGPVIAPRPGPLEADPDIESWEKMRPRGEA